MNTIDCIKTRRSVRKFKDEQIKDDELIQVLEAGNMVAHQHGCPASPYHCSAKPGIHRTAEEDERRGS